MLWVSSMKKNWMINPSRSLNLVQKYLLYLFPIICYASDVKLSYVRMISLFIFTVIFCLCKKKKLMRLSDKS